MEDTKILVIDDEKNILESIKMVLAYESYQVDTCSSGLDGMELFKTLNPDIVLLDVKMPGFDGIEVLKNLKNINKLSEIIMISGHSGIQEALEASRLGAFDFLEKPISREKLLLTVRNASEKVNLLKENYNLKGISEKKYVLIGESPVMKKLKETIQRVAKSDSTVLIFGHSGTGKELISRNIHHFSRRKDKKFVQVNCAAIPDELIESELFGHEKGAFTGAIKQQIGRFELANKGTIFLDEIGELPIELQPKLLRVLQDGEFEKVGNPRTIKIDARIIAATNRNLEEDIQQNLFRKDLYYRLKVYPITIAPLRDRISDIPLLAEDFVKRFNLKLGKCITKIPAKTIKQLQNYSWPGNIRELENIIERCVVLDSGDGIITHSTLPAAVQQKSQTELITTKLPQEGLDLEDVVARLETDLI
ncbi:MAG: sigma-54-dependent Fis family transcriptional regulator, partial [Candidatus Aminicenantes bacterium]|nr:sigma-54-dependent Fis family transcriptional regulator [Candidatus Aminicenantes bacterium]